MVHGDIVSRGQTLRVTVLGGPAATERLAERVCMATGRGTRSANKLVRHSELWYIISEKPKALRQSLDSCRTAGLSTEASAGHVVVTVLNTVGSLV